MTPEEIINTLRELNEKEKISQMIEAEQKLRDTSKCGHRETDYCNCPCHTTPDMKHIQSCCNPCPQCGVRIKRR